MLRRSGNITISTRRLLLAAPVAALLIGGCQRNGRPEAPVAPSPGAEAVAPGPGAEAPAPAPPPAGGEGSAAEEASGAPTACTGDADCGVYLLPRCVKGGCSPPCGNVYRTEPAALNQERAQEHITALQQREEAACQIVCIMCVGTPPTPPDVSGFRAVCREGRCTLQGS